MLGLRFCARAFSSCGKRGPLFVAASGGRSSSRCAGPSLSRPLPLWSTDSRCAGSVVVAHGLSRSAACGIFPDQGSKPCPLHWQADSQPLCHQGSPFPHLYWSIIALQCCVSFCCTTKWISYTYTYIPISPPTWASLLPSLSHPSRWSQSTELISLCYAAASH